MSDDMEGRVRAMLDTLGAGRTDGQIVRAAITASQEPRRTTLVHRAPATTPTRRASVSRSDRELEGMFATAPERDGSGSVRVFVVTVETRANGIVKAYCTRQDDRRRDWWPVSELSNASDVEAEA